MLPALTLVLLGQFIPGTKLVTAPEPPLTPPSTLVWRTDDVLGRGADRSFIATGTRAGQRYRLKATGVCKWEGTPVYFVGGPPGRVFRRTGHIFGIDFRVQLGGSPDKQILEVGAHRPEETALDFVADHDDVPLRIFDNWDLPKGVTCTIDGIEVVSAPASP